MEALVLVLALAVFRFVAFGFAAFVIRSAGTAMLMDSANVTKRHNRIRYTSTMNFQEVDGGGCFAAAMLAGDCGELGRRDRFIARS